MRRHKAHDATLAATARPTPSSSVALKQPRERAEIEAT
jgi:hypothetical protein